MPNCVNHLPGIICNLCLGYDVIIQKLVTTNTLQKCDQPVDFCPLSLSIKTKIFSMAITTHVALLIV